MRETIKYLGQENGVAEYEESDPEGLYRYSEEGKVTGIKDGLSPKKYTSEKIPLRERKK